MEILTDRYYTLGVRFSYLEDHSEFESPSNGNGMHVHPVETVWGGDGDQFISSIDGGTGFHFEKISRTNVRSSWANGQIPILYYN